MILFFCCSIAWCSDTQVTTKEQNHISHMGIRTPCYTTIKEQHHISHMGIRTPCYTTIKEQNHISHMGIRTPCYTTIKGQNHISHMGILQLKAYIIVYFHRSIAWCSDTHLTNIICPFIVVWRGVLISISPT
jgi:hypothetical protein